MDFGPPRGTTDWLPPRSEELSAFYEIAHRVAHRYGYHYVETPTFEATDLFARSSGDTSDIVSKEMYTFQDRGKRSVTLRPEGTAPVVRAYLAHAHELPVPFKGYYVETLFRYGRPQRGRLREYRSFGIEVIGASDAEADVEVIAVGAEFLREAYVTAYSLQLNSLGDSECRPTYRQALLEYLERNANRLRDEHRERFRENPLRVLDCKDEACRAVASQAPRMIDYLCDRCKPHFETVKSGLRREGISYDIVPTLARGLDYYTRTAFEFVGRGLSESQGTIIGGGRYDGLAQVLGSRTEVPAVGFGAGIERAILALSAEGTPPPRAGGLDCFVMFREEGQREYSRGVSRQLRAAGLSADMIFWVRAFETNVRMATLSGARFAVIIGAREAERGNVTCKRLSDGYEQELELEQAIQWMAAGPEAEA